MMAGTEIAYAIERGGGDVMVYWLAVRVGVAVNHKRPLSKAGAMSRCGEIISRHEELTGTLYSLVAKFRFDILPLGPIFIREELQVCVAEPNPTLTLTLTLTLTVCRPCWSWQT